MLMCCRWWTVVARDGGTAALRLWIRTCWSIRRAARTSWLIWKPAIHAFKVIGSPGITFYLYNDGIMGAIASQITSLTIVYSTVYSDEDERKHQSSASLAFVWGIHRWPVNSPHKWPVTRKMFPFDEVIMTLLALCVGNPPGTSGCPKQRARDANFWSIMTSWHGSDFHTSGLFCSELWIPITTG